MNSRRLLSQALEDGLGALPRTAYVPALNERFTTVALGAQELGIVVGLSVVPFLSVEGCGGLFRRAGGPLEEGTA